MSEFGDEAAIQPETGSASAWIDLCERAPGPSQAELEWATEIADKLQDPALEPAELERFQAIAAAFIASREDLPPPSSQELSWFQEREALYLAGQAPSHEEAARLRDICARFLLAQARELYAQLQSLPPATAPPTPQDQAWARTLHTKGLNGQVPNQADYRRYLQVLRACADFKIKLNSEEGARDEGRGTRRE